MKMCMVQKIFLKVKGLLLSSVAKIQQNPTNEVIKVMFVQESSPVQQQQSTMKVVHGVHHGQQMILSFSRFQIQRRTNHHI